MKALICTALAFLASPALAGLPKPPDAPVVSPDGALYRQFGGHDGVVRVVDDMFVNIMADERISGFFDPTKQPHTKAMIVEQFCQIMGGGCVYSGKDMGAVHGELGITKADFNALVEDLQTAMDKNHVPFAAQSQLLAALAPQNREIVYRAGAPADVVSQPPTQ